MSAKGAKAATASLGGARAMATPAACADEPGTQQTIAAKARPTEGIWTVVNGTYLATGLGVAKSAGMPSSKQAAGTRTTTSSGSGRTRLVSGGADLTPRTCISTVLAEEHYSPTPDYSHGEAEETAPRQPGETACSKGAEGAPQENKQLVQNEQAALAKDSVKEAPRPRDATAARANTPALTEEPLEDPFLLSSLPKDESTRTEILRWLSENGVASAKKFVS